ncbi:MAG: ABC transporter ATP-binding protein [Sphingomonadales bacterium]|nr:ABC transporter ATP-binding protein [Sphingomonadales bacterium]
MPHKGTPLLEVKNLSKAYGREQVLNGVSLTVAAGKTMAVLGQSGCGKTTLLKILAGLEGLDNGEVILNGQQITAAPPRGRGMVYLYQEALLFPHLNVFDNIAFGLKLKKMPDGEISYKVEEKLVALGLEQHAHKMPDQLSGGQRGRVNFGRALIIKPKMLLLDEPFGALDTSTRARMQNLFTDVAHAEGISTLFVTHDLKEALLMGDTFAHMEGGNLTSYASRDAFINAPETGVMTERDFWQGLD